MADSTFGERFTFARLWQSLHVLDEEDKDFARHVGKSKGSISTYYHRETAPPAEGVGRMAARMGVDPGWLTHGGATAAPAGFADWLERQRGARKARGRYRKAPTADTPARKRGHG